MTDDRFRERLSEIAEPFGSKAGLAKAAGVPVTSFQGYLNGSEPTRLALVALAQAAGVSVHWLATGEGPKAASIAPEGYLELRCFNLSGIGPSIRGMIGDPAGRRLFKKDDFPEYVNKLGLVAAVEGCPELSFEPAILGADVFIFEQILWVTGRPPNIFNLWPILNRADDIYLIADSANLRLRKLLLRKGSISPREFRRKLSMASLLSPDAPPLPADSISISVIAPNGKTERTLTGADAPGDFIVFGRVIWRSGMLPGASITALPDVPPEEYRPHQK